MKIFFFKFLTVFFSLMMVFFTIELILNIKSYKNLNKINEKNLDQRTVYEVYKENLERGKRITPWMGPAVLNEIDSLYPLSGVSNINTIFCNEVGEWKIYKSDKYGFNNKNINYEKDIEILIIGDSFAEGSCVNYENSFQGNFSKKGFNSISLGKGGNDTLLSFATLKEYIENFKPKKVIWFHYVNDVEDISFIIKNKNKKKFIFKYLENDDFSQNLILRQNEIDKFLINSIEKNKRNLDRKFLIRKSFRYSELKRILTFYNIRQLIFTKFKSNNSYKYREELKLFEKAIVKSVNITKKFNSEFIFVYIPWQNNYTINKEHSLKKEVFKILDTKKINYIDVDKIFKKNKNPSNFYNRNQVHFNETGFKEISNYIINNFLN